ncbi:pseudouridine synthase [Marinomonas ostreistagni]|uniref:pseudouridine synthase n=1 Tax=Marinomonas ostreistagni TaxID=359209 RepID=UPI00194F03DB|nr:pseudouridine synthase [Marinomonas ostreistagni]MBM6549610.1 pseudouridine synthase [Marinomonas ostreistagni]
MSKPFTDAVVRLDFYISHTLGLSRKEAKMLIGKGHVNVNGELVKKANHSVTREDTIVCQEEELSWPAEKYFVLNKPAGFVCATEDDVHPVVLELIEAHEQKDLRVVGRLDLDTTGLLLLTTDGQWLHRITSPKSQCPKQYRVWTVDDVTDEAMQALQEGVMLNGEHAPTQADAVERVDCDEILLTISEGKYHQVKRMLAATGNRVEKLHRETIASLSIDDLAEGEYRALTDEEIALF